MTAVATDRILGVNTGLAVKAPCVAVATANIPLTGLTAVGSYSPNVGDRILVIGQTDQTTNGIYQAQTGGWTRTADFSNNNDLVTGTLVTVTFPSGGQIFYQLTTANPISLGSSLITFEPVTPPNLNYAITPYEAAADVTVVNGQYLPGVVDRYGTNAAPGATDMTAAFQAAINQARKGGADVVWGFTGIYCLATGALDCTFTGSGSQFGLNFRQVSTPGVNFATGPGNLKCGLYVTHADYTVFDLTGCSRYAFYDLSAVVGVYVPGNTPPVTVGTYPQTMFLTARNAAGGSVFPRFFNTFISGYFSIALLYNYAAEDGIYQGNYWGNSATDARASLIVITAKNYFKGTDLQMSSRFTTIFNGADSCIDHQFIGGQYQMIAPSATSDIFYLDACQDVKVLFPWVANPAGRSYFYVELANGPAGRVFITGLQGEVGSGPSYGILIPNAAGTPSEYSLTDVFWDVLTASVATAGTTPVLDNLYVRGLFENVTKGILVPGTLQNSNIEYQGIVTAGTGNALKISGTLANIAITTKNSVIIEDQPQGSLVVSGSLRMANKPAFGTQTGWGTPTGGAIVNNFPGSAATLAQCGEALSEVIAMLQNLGVLGT